MTVNVSHISSCRSIRAGGGGTMAWIAPYVLTKLDLAAISKCDYLTVRFAGSDVGRSRVDAIKRAVKTGSDPFAVDRYHAIAAPIGVFGYDYKPDDVCRVTCVEVLWLYHDQHGHVASVFGTLRAGDAIKFEFYPDCHSNGNMARAGLHGDALRLHVYRGDEAVRRLVAVWELATQCSPDNSARMCRGVGASESYRRQAESV